MTSYNPVTGEIVEKLRTICGPSYVLADDPDRLEPYSHDEIPDPKYAHMPEVVVRPRTAEEIASIMRLANRETIAVTP